MADTKGFDAAAKVDIAANTIELGAGHGLTAGQAVVYHKGAGGTEIGGLTEGSTYYVIKSGADKVKLATSAEAAKAGTAIDLTSTGAGAAQDLAIDKAHGVDNAVTSQRNLADKKATEGGTTDSGSSTAPKAESSKGGISVAAAIGLNISNSEARAYIPDNGIVSAGGILKLATSNNTDGKASADGSASGGGAATIGAAVAINVVRSVNDATVGAGATVTAGGLVLEAKMTDVDGDTSHAFGASATSGASGGSIGVAGSFALNVADSRGTAQIKDGATVTLSGTADVNLAAENTSDSTVIAKADSKVGGSVGVGASVALNISNATTVAEVSDGVLLAGAHDLLLSAASDNTVTTTAKAGGAAGGSGGIGIGGAISLAVATNTSRAVIGTARAAETLTVSGRLNAEAKHKGVTNTLADGSASGAAAGIGIALGLNVVNDITTATTRRTLNAAGDLGFIAHNASASSVESKASAAGGEGEEQNGSSQDGVDQQIGAQKGLADKKATEGGTTGTGGSTAPKAESSQGGVSVAGAVAVNLSKSHALAYIPDNGVVSSGGLLTLSASNNTDGVAKADGTASSGGAGTGVGVAVGINLVNARNEATVGAGATVNAQWLTVEALMTDVGGDTTSTVGADAVSGASGGKIGIAGSLALNIVDNKNLAEIRSGATVTLAGGDVRLAAEGNSASTVNATAQAAGAGSSSTPTAAAANEASINPVTTATQIGTAEGQLKATFAAAGTNDLKFTLRDGSLINVGLNGATTLQQVLDKINTAGKPAGVVKLEAQFDAVTHALKLIDHTTVGVTQLATATTQTGSPVFYTRNGGTAVAAPKSGAATSEALDFALRAGTTSERVFVSLAAKTYTGTDAAMKAAWLADLKAAVKASMVAAGQLAATDAATVNVLFINNKLIFEAAKTLTIWTDTSAATGKTFKVQAVGASTAIVDLGLGSVAIGGTDLDENGIILGQALAVTGAAAGAAIDLTAAGTGTADFTAAKTFDAAAKVDIATNSITLGSGHGLVTGQSVVYHKGTGTLVGGLTDGSTYYVIGGSTGIKLASSAANATAGAAIDLTSAGTGTADLTFTKTFDAAAKVDLENDTIDLGAGHGFTAGQAVVYHKGTGTAIAGLTDGTSYNVVLIGANKIKLAASAAA
ncbi:hypothetical protein, partial [Reyranella sp.]|uniref:beta strand repeat-containing protein n=1 Tax=Reyranella sp. TaxID=1929291 RepID=UPI002731A1C1